MQISSIKTNYLSQNKAINAGLMHSSIVSNPVIENKTEKKSVDYSNIISYFPNISPVSFSGASSNLKRMMAVSPEGKKYFLSKATDGSYMVDAETVTKLYYGKDAEKFLKNRTIFPQKTQIICPNDGELLVEDTKNGEQINIVSDGAVVLGEGREAKVSIIKGNPLVITSERKPVWYEEFCNNPKSKTQIDMFEHLNNVYGHYYNGHIKISDIGEEIAGKLIDADKADMVSDNHIKMRQFYMPDYMEKDLQDILTPEELLVFKPHYKKAAMLKLTTKEARKVHADSLDPKLKDKLIKTGLIIDLDKCDKGRIYWNELFHNKKELQKKLQDHGFNAKEQEKIIKFWNKTNKTGLDYTGLRYLAEDMAVFSLANRINNMTGGSQHWNTTSFITSSIVETAKTPFISVSAKHSDIDYKEPVLYKKLRNAETLHSHPSDINLHQTEVYIITEGAGALTVIENNEPKTVIVKQGEGIVLQPGVKHCVSAFKGKYEHLVCQIPCLFQYGSGISKKDWAYPDGYSESTATENSLKKLAQVKL